MKQLILGAIGILSLGHAANAADLPNQLYTKAPAADPAYNWTGFYAGVHAGYAFGSTQWQVMNVPTDGALGGIQAGYNQQIGNLVFGVEADISFGGINGSRTINFLNQTILSQRSEINWLSTVTGRVGFANGRWLTYAKTGFAWANEDHGYNVQISTPPDRLMLSGSETRRGWLVGAGMEYALANNWSLRGEYNYISFPDQEFDISGTRSSTGSFTSTASTKQPLHLIKLGANYQFGAPDAAKPIPPLRYATTGFSWTGLYLGAQAGYGSGQADWRDYAAVGKFNTTGGFGGGQIGANVQLGVIVMGVEGELVGGDIGGATRLRTGDGAIDLKSRTEWLAMATARIGMVTDERWLTYVKGGVAVAGNHHDISLVAGAQSAGLDGSHLHTGYVVGAGVEYAFAPNWSVKAEYNYIGFGHDKASLEGVINAPPAVGPYYLSADIAQNMQLGKIGVNYHFAP